MIRGSIRNRWRPRADCSIEATAPTAPTLDSFVNFPSRSTSAALKIVIRSLTKGLTIHAGEVDFAIILRRRNAIQFAVDERAAGEFLLVNVTRQDIQQ